MASNTGDRGYTAAAIRQAEASGMSRADARALVNRNANTRTRTSSRQNYVNRIGIGR